MAANVFKVVELAGQSKTGYEDAITNALKRASKTIEHIRWFQVLEWRGHVEDGQVKEWQVVIKVGFGLDE